VPAMRCGGWRSEDRLPFLFIRVHAEFTSDCQFPDYPRQKSVGHVRLGSLALTFILMGARAGLYPLLNLNSMESPIGPNSERGYFAAFEELIDSRRMNLQKLGNFFYG
jgi:hypothetical protein